MTSTPYVFNPALDLVLERVIDVPPALVWKAWTTPEILVKWFTPAPWSTTRCEMDLRPGGRMLTVMRSPEGEEFPNEGCLLEIVEGFRLVFTSVMTGGFRPVKLSGSDADLPFTAVISIEPHGAGTRYTATAIHADEAGVAKHVAMGFHEGWSAALDQLVALMKTVG